ncbi:MAG TPA: CAP domain-containing protein, partial [Ilumatobacteraceae bacterium]|nr:CAP domain-containing protein [Ilumatobacteraceae bacterium]
MPTISTATIAAHSSSARRRLTVALGTALLCTTLVVGGTTSPASASGPAADDWLGIVNVYRAQSGLAPVVNNSAWSSGALNHSCWMLLNGIAHDEVPGTPGYTVEGDQAGNSGNVASSSNAAATPLSHINLWMSGPFHAIGLLRPGLQQAAFGMCASPPNPTNTQWKSAATLDVVRGTNWGVPKPATPIVFPGNGATTNLTRFIAETPDPRSFCGWGAQTVGLPLIALMPSNVTAANATLVGPSGPVPTCVLHKSNPNGVASSILGGDNAVVVVPASPLTTGRYTVSVGSNGGNANWSFNVDPSAPLSLVPAAPPAAPGPLSNTSALTTEMPFQPVTPFRFADSRSNLALGRLPAKQQVRVRIAGVSGLPPDITAVSANFTAVGAPQDGYLTASNCAEVDPSFSTLNYEANDGVPNQAIIPLSGGHLCLFSSEATDIVIDVNGYVSPSAKQVFVPV